MLQKINSLPVIIRKNKSGKHNMAKKKKVAKKKKASKKKKR